MITITTVLAFLVGVLGGGIAAHLFVRNNPVKTQMLVDKLEAIEKKLGIGQKEVEKTEVSG